MKPDALPGRLPPAVRAVVEALGSASANKRREILQQLDDHSWLELNCAVQADRNPLREILPDVPSDTTRRAFTSRGGREDFEQAFSFYRHARRWCEREGVPRWKEGRVLDFGCGWGRVLRFWIKDLDPDQLWGVDCLSYAMNWFERTRNPAHGRRIDQEPPLEGELPLFSLIYAFSVFSHLSEDLARRWIHHLATRLCPGGLLILTTRGREFLADLESKQSAGAEGYTERVLETAPPIDGVRRRLEEGELVFWETQGEEGGELRRDLYGEALIPRRWAEPAIAGTALRLLAFEEGVPAVDQAILTFRKLP